MKITFQSLFIRLMFKGDAIQAIIKLLPHLLPVTFALLLTLETWYCLTVTYYFPKAKTMAALNEW